MNKQAKTVIVLGLTISLASVPTLSEVSKANEINEVQEKSLSLLSTEVDGAMQRVKVDQLSMDDFALTILEQPDIVDLEVMEDLPKHQQTIGEDAEVFLKDIKPELIDLNERTILVAEYMRVYNDFFVNEIQNIQETKSNEEEVRQNIEAGLQELEAIIEEEIAEIKDTHKKTEDFLVSFEENYQAFALGVAEAEEYVIQQEGEIAEEVAQLKDDIDDIINDTNGRSWLDYLELIGIALTIVFPASMGAKLGGRIAARGFKSGFPLTRAQWGVEPGKYFGSRIAGGLLGAASGTGVFLYFYYDWLDQGYGDALNDIQAASESLSGLQEELFVVNLIEQHAEAFVDASGEQKTNLETLTNEWSILQNNIQTMSNDIQDDNLNELKLQFEKSSVYWEDTKNISEYYQALDDAAPIEVNIDEMDTVDEQIGERYDADEIKGIDFDDLADLTSEELEEYLRELLGEEMVGTSTN